MLTSPVRLTSKDSVIGAIAIGITASIRITGTAPSGSAGSRVVRA
jgi:hypothetical protein